MGTKTAATTAIIYTRISDDQADGAGVARQEADCRDLAAQHGYTVATVFSDNNTSAFNGKRRPAFEELLTVARHHDAVLVWATDRLYRRLTDLERIVDDLGHTPVLAVKSGRVDLSSADGRMHARMLGTVAQHSSEKSAERVAAAARHRALQGRSTTASRPFGWKRIPGGLAPDPVEAPAVAKAYDMFLAGESLAGIARWLNDQGFTTARASRPFTQASVTALLRTPRHGGLVQYQGQIVPDAVNADGRLVEPSVWWAAHAIWSQPNRKKRGPQPGALLSGKIMACKKCGGVVRASSSKTNASGERYLTYGCRGGGTGGVGHVQWRRDVLDTAVTDRVLGFLLVNREVLREARAAAAAGGPGADAAAADLARARADREGLAAAFATGAVSLAAFTTASKALDEQIAAAEARVRPAAPSQVTDLLDADDLVAAWESTTLLHRQAIVMELVANIIVGRRADDDITVQWRA